MTTPTKAYIISRFNAVVAAQSNRNFATYHSSSFPNAILRPGSTPLGPRSEPNKVVSDINVTGMMATNVFEILHNLAMQITRVRQARNTYLIDNRDQTDGTNKSVPSSLQLTALHSRHALYFDFPGPRKEVGDTISTADLESFLSTLRSTVASIRYSTNHYFEIVSCHSSCHSSCHGSRGRR